MPNLTKPPPGLYQRAVCLSVRSVPYVPTDTSVTVPYISVIYTRCANHSLSSIDVVVVIVITVISVSVQIVMCPTREEAGMSAPRASEASVLLVNFRYYVRSYVYPRVSSLQTLPN